MSSALCCQSSGENLVPFLYLGTCRQWSLYLLSVVCSTRDRHLNVISPPHQSSLFIPHYKISSILLILNNSSFPLLLHLSISCWHQCCESKSGNSLFLTWTPTLWSWLLVFVLGIELRASCTPGQVFCHWTPCPVNQDLLNTNMFETAFLLIKLNTFLFNKIAFPFEGLSLKIKTCRLLLAFPTIANTQKEKDVLSSTLSPSLPLPCLTLSGNWEVRGKWGKMIFRKGMLDATVILIVLWDFFFNLFLFFFFLKFALQRFLLVLVSF